MPKLSLLVCVIATLTQAQGFGAPAVAPAAAVVAAAVKRDAKRPLSYRPKGNGALHSGGTSHEIATKNITHKVLPGVTSFQETGGSASGDASKFDKHDFNILKLFGDKDIKYDTKQDPTIELLTVCNSTLNTVASEVSIYISNVTNYASNVSNIYNNTFKTYQNTLVQLFGGMKPQMVDNSPLVAINIAITKNGGSKSVTNFFIVNSQGQLTPAFPSASAPATPGLSATAIATAVAAATATANAAATAAAQCNSQCSALAQACPGIGYYPMYNSPSPTPGGSACNGCGGLPAVWNRVSDPCSACYEQQCAAQENYAVCSFSGDAEQVISYACDTADVLTALQEYAPDPDPDTAAVEEVVLAAAEGICVVGGAIEDFEFCSPPVPGTSVGSCPTIGNLRQLFCAPATDTVTCTIFDSLCLDPTLTYPSLCASQCIGAIQGCGADVLGGISDAVQQLWNQIDPSDLANALQNFPSIGSLNLPDINIPTSLPSIPTPSGDNGGELGKITGGLF